MLHWLDRALPFVALSHVFMTLVYLGIDFFFDSVSVLIVYVLWASSVVIIANLCLSYTLECMERRKRKILTRTKTKKREAEEKIKTALRTARYMRKSDRAAYLENTGLFKV